MWLIARSDAVAAAVKRRRRRALRARHSGAERVTRPLRRRRGLRREDLRQPVDVELVEHAPALRLLEACDELRAEDVDLPVQQPPLVRDLLLLRRQVVDQALQLVVAEPSEVRRWLHSPPFVVEGRTLS